MNLIVIIIAILVVILFRYLRSPTRIGKIGESRVAWEIDRLDVNNFRVFNDLLLQHNEETCQIDHIIISIYGIFVIETKNYSGWIFGNDSSDYWTQVIYKTKNKFRNPIKQNWSHICFLKTILRERASIKYIPIVAFAGNADAGDGLDAGAGYQCTIGCRCRRLSHLVICAGDSRCIGGIRPTEREGIVRRPSDRQRNQVDGRVGRGGIVT
mgnify:CR=1 FL=1